MFKVGTKGEAMTKLEQVARAIRSVTFPFDECGDGLRDLAMREAHAAIEAMKGPTEKMVDAGCRMWGRRTPTDTLDDTARDTFNAMIDCALGEE